MNLKCRRWDSGGTFSALDTCAVLGATACRRNGLLSVKITKTSMTCSPSLSMPLRCKGIAAHPHARPRRVAFGNSPALPG